MSGVHCLGILVGSLEIPHVNSLYDCQVLPCAPHSNHIAKAVHNAVRSFGINKYYFCVLSSGTVKHCCSAILKSMYFKLFHMTCVAYILHNFVIKVKSRYDDVDQVIVKVKSATVKNKIRQVKFRYYCWLALASCYKMGKPVECFLIPFKEFT